MAAPAPVKENVYVGPPLSAGWLLGALLLAAAALALALRAGRALPAPLSAAAPKHRFRAEAARWHLTNLTAIGPRVAGSYENEVAAVRYAVTAARAVAALASPHNVVEVDRAEASGAFSLAFFDGLNHVYRGVQSVLLRVRGAGGRGGEPALLINCHLDTVPDSPGASDDAAGCAVALEVARALAAGGPLRHTVVVLLNGAEENIMQASHGVITTHPWAKAVRAFINIEACGSGGREVMFQAGPHDPWLVEVYADVVPHPFASSLAQEMFESGLIPADTDFRIFRDFGKLSGVDLAWSSNGYVYHTRLDTADRIPAAALQRTGDNVLALARALLSGEQLDAPVDRAARPPVFFDVLGLAVVWTRAPVAALVALGTVALVVLDVHLTAEDARRRLFVSRGAWWRAVAREAAAVSAASAAGVATSAGVALALHAARARLAFYSHDWLLAPLYAVPALCASWLAVRRGGSAAGAARGWWRARAVHAALSVLTATVLLASVARGLRSGFLPLLWSLLPAAADTAAHLLKATDGWRCAWWCGGALPAMLQTWYMSADLLATLLPITGRAGSPALPPDVLVAAVVAALVLASTSWMLPLAVAARGVERAACAALAASALLAALVAGGPLYAPYSAERPQRLMVFHTRRTEHAPLWAPQGTPPARVDHVFWLPELDANTPHSLYPYVPELRRAVPVAAEACGRWVYCGAPYYLPVLALVPRSHELPAPGPPRAALHADVRWRALNDSAVEITFDIAGPSHVVAIVSPAEGVRLAAGGGLPAPLAAARWGARRTYFVMLFAAPPTARRLRLELVRAGGAADGGGGQHTQHGAGESWAQVSLAGHAMAGEAAVSAAQAALLRPAPAWLAATGWGVDLHLYRL